MDAPTLADGGALLAFATDLRAKRAETGSGQ